MRLIIFAILLLMLTGPMPAPLQAQTDAPEAPAAVPKAEAAGEGLPDKAPTVFSIGPFPVTNSMLVTWIVAAGIIVFARCATRRMKAVPDGAQNFWEFLVERTYEQDRISGYSRDVDGHSLARLGRTPGDGMKMSDCEDCHHRRNVEVGCLGCHQ